MANKKIKAVLFDLGETLITFGRVNTTILFYEGASLSYSFLKEKGQPVGSFTAYCLRNFIPLRIKYFFSKLGTVDFDSLELLKKINGKKGIRLDEAGWRQLAWLWYEPLSKLGKAESDIVSSLNALEQAGLKLGIISNTFINGCCLDKHLENLEMLDFFQFRFYSYEFGFRKPDPRIFQAACEKIGELPENILFVGDRVDNDISPALKAGMRSVLKKAYTNSGKEIPDGITVIDKVSELPALIQKINASAQD
jgi:putative hydrolase of the HAD superfamily